MVIASYILIVVADTSNIVAEARRVKTVSDVRVIRQRRQSDDLRHYRIQCALVSDRQQIDGLESSIRSRVTEYPRSGLGRKHGSISGNRKIIPKALVCTEEVSLILSVPN